MYTIGVDCRLAGKKHAGIGRYIENLVQRLPRLTKADEIRWKFFFHDWAQAEEVLAPLEGEEASYTVQLAPFGHYGIEEQLKFPGILNAAELDVFHVPHFNIPVLYRGKMVVTIHDLLWHEYRGTEVTTLPKWQYWIKYAAYRWIVSQATARAQTVLVPTKSIARAVQKHFPQIKSEIVVTPEGVSFTNDQLQLTKAARKKRGDDLFKNTPRPLLFIGSLYPHKNVQLIINALVELPEYELWIVGTRSVFVDRVKAMVKEKNLHQRVKFLGYQTDEAVLKLYEEVFALVQPSLSEGFGLTGIEALAAGVPVLASDIPVFHEVYQEHALFFDPYSAESFITSLSQLTPAHAKHILQEGSELLKEYSWDDMASKTLKIYRNVLASHAKVV